MSEKKDKYMELFKEEDNNTLEYASEYYDNNFLDEKEEEESNFEAEYNEYYYKTEYLESVIEQKIENYEVFNVDAPLRYCDKYFLMALEYFRSENPKKLLLLWEDNICYVIDTLVAIDKQMQNQYDYYIEKKFDNPFEYVNKDMMEAVKTKFKL